jgi:hypothetical protein
MATYVSLSGFAGLSFFTAVVQQQRKAEGHLLPVPSVQQQPLATHDEDPNNHAIQGMWVQQSVQLALDQGYTQQQIGDVAAAPRSKAERSFSKRSWAVLGQHVQPSVKQWHSTSHGNDHAAPASAVANCSDPPAASARTVAEVAASQVASFSRCSSAAPGSTSISSCGTFSCGTTAAAGGLAAGLLLDAPVILGLGACWGEDARWQVGCDYVHLSTADQNLAHASLCSVLGVEELVMRHQTKRLTHAQVPQVQF